MNTKRLIISSLLFLSANSTVFASLDTDMKRCAGQALDQLNVSTGSIVVNNPTDDIEVMDFDISSVSRELRMNIASPSSGKDFGDVVCYMDNSGEISSVKFLSKQ